MGRAQIRTDETQCCPVRLRTEVVKPLLKMKENSFKNWSAVVRKSMLWHQLLKARLWAVSFRHVL